MNSVSMEGRIFHCGELLTNENRNFRKSSLSSLVASIPYLKFPSMLMSTS